MTEQPPDGAGEPVDSRVVLLTGGTSGIGRIASLRLAEQGATVAVVGRNEKRGNRLVADTANAAGEVHFHRADLSTHAAVRSLAEEIRETYDRLDVLAHNAGLSVTDRRETADGIELTFAVNHLAPYLLTHDLVEQLLASSPSRVVVTASGVHRRGTLDFDDLQFEQKYGALDAYARSKLANVAFTLELARRLPDDVTANCFHPGFVPSTGLFRNARLRTRLLMQFFSAVRIGTSADEGAQRLVTLATDPEFAVRTGTYIGSSGIESPAVEAQEHETRERLWNVSADLVGVDPDWP